MHSDRFQKPRDQLPLKNPNQVRGNEEGEEEELEAEDHCWMIRQKWSMDQILVFIFSKRTSSEIGFQIFPQDTLLDNYQ